MKETYTDLTKPMLGVFRYALLVALVDTMVLLLLLG